ncbi:MAG TPA: carboxypeptidase-like regulatory domain-containing protein [Candidatus Paceibacterota bacterium]|nr:carboxypeptidase-like regulatory domain-containing protein [Candidatus Paceibacterota bacterium]
MFSNGMRGVSLVDVIVGSALVLIIFLALFGLLRGSILISSLAKMKAGATAIANSQMEYMRSLPYDSVGTIGGIPAGLIAATSTTVLNGTTYNVRTLVVYEDDPKDGLGAADSNHITTDYKRVRVEVSYTAREQERDVVLISNRAPIGLETTTGGGTLQVNVVNAVGAGVPGASVTIENSRTSPSIGVTTFSNADGIVYLPGAPTSTDYRIRVAKDGYSSAQTYARDATNQNPSPGYLTVVGNQTTAGTFAIDALASLTLRTLFPKKATTTADTFSSGAHITDMTNAAVAGGALELANALGVYAASGSARSIPAAPSYLAAWTSASSDLALPGGTTALVQVTDGSGTPLPDAALPGNGDGFSSFPIDLSGISTSTYPSLGLKATLATASTATTPRVLDWTLAYEVGPIPVPDVAFTLLGTKAIGSTGAGAPIYKTAIDSATDAAGIRSLELEWDSYAFDVTGYDVIDACVQPPFALSPGATVDSALMLGPATSHALLVSVRDAGGLPVEGASVTLARGGYSASVETSACGGAYFGGIASANDYTVGIAKPGHASASFDGVAASGTAFFTAAFE